MAKVFYDGFLKPKTFEPEIQRVPERIELAKETILGEEVSVFLLTVGQRLSIECSEEMESRLQGFDFEPFNFMPANNGTAELILSELKRHLTLAEASGTTKEGKRDI